MADKEVSVGSIFLDLIIRNTAQEQIQNIAGQAQNAAQKALSGVEATAEETAKKAAAQIGKPAEHTVRAVKEVAKGANEAAAASARKVSEDTAKSAARAAQSVKKNIEAVSRLEPSLAQSADKGTQKLLADIQKMEQQLQALDLEKEMEIHADTEVFEQAVADAKARIKQLKTQIAELNARIAAGEGNPGLLNQRGQLQGQLHIAKTQKNVAAQMLDQQRELAESKAGEKVRAQQEKLYAQLDAARKKLTESIAASAQKQASEEIAAVQKTAKAAEASAVKRKETVRQAHVSADPPSRAVPEAAPAPRAPNPQTENHGTIWKKLTALAGGFRRAAAGAFTTAGKAAGSLLGKLAGMTKALFRVNQTSGGFGSRIKEIASGALVFNGISSALQRAVSYFSDAIASTDEMKGTLADLRGAAANAASPIIQVLTPALAALANTAATVFSYVAKLLTTLTGKVSTASSTAAKSASGAASAARKAAASLAGFDELQKLDGDKSDSGGSGSGADQTVPNYNFEGKSPFLDQLLEAVEKGRWDAIGTLVARKLNEGLKTIPWEKIQTKAAQWTRNLVDIIHGFTGNLNWELLGSSVGNGLNTVTTVIRTFFTGVNWEELGKYFGTGLRGLVDTIDWTQLGQALYDSLNAMFGLLYGFLQSFDVGNLRNHLSDLLNAAFGGIDWGKAGKALSDGILGQITGMTTLLAETDWKGIGRSVESFLEGIDWSGIASGLFSGIGAALGGLGALIWEIIEDEWNAMIDTWLENTEKCGGDIIAGLLVSIVQGLANIGKWIVDNVFTPFINGFKDAFGIHSPSKVMEDQGGFIISGLLGGITDAWTSVPEFFRTALADIHSKLTGAFEGMKKTVADIWENGIVPAVKSPINGIISAINGMISGIVTGINTVIRALNRLHFEIPDWVPGLGGKTFGFNIGELSAPQIPMLKNGGVITQPTLAMMGEYAGARNNPEIVAPQSILEETMTGVLDAMIASNMQGFESVVAVLREILEAVLGIEIDGEILARAVENYRRKMAVVKGGT